MGCSAKQDVQFRYSQISVMLEFLRAGLFNKKPVISEFNIIDWDKLMDMSSQQGVLAFVWDGICNLPQNQQPPRIQRINFSMSAQQIWDRYDMQVQVLNDMIKKCNQNNLRLLLLKGIGLSNYYPNPSSRPCGDIDFYLFGKYSEGIRLFFSGNMTTSNKHAECDYNGVHIENHITMLDADTRKRKKVEKYLEESLINAKRTSQGYYLLPPIANLVYLLMHSIRHFVYSQSLTIRNCMDFAFFIKANKNDVLSIECIDNLKRFDLLKTYDLFVYLSEWVLDTELSEYHVGLIQRRDLLKIREYVMEHWLIDNTHVNGDLWHRYFILVLFTPYIPKQYNNYFIHITFLQLTAIIKKLLKYPQGKNLNKLINPQ